MLNKSNVWETIDNGILEALSSFEVVKKIRRSSKRIVLHHLNSFGTRSLQHYTTQQRCYISPSYWNHSEVWGRKRTDCQISHETGSYEQMFFPTECSWRYPQEKLRKWSAETGTRIPNWTSYSINSSMTTRNHLEKGI